MATNKLYVTFGMNTLFIQASKHLYNHFIFIIVTFIPLVSKTSNVFIPNSLLCNHLIQQIFINRLDEDIILLFSLPPNVHTMIRLLFS